MTKLEFSIDLLSDSKSIFDLMVDYESYSSYIPAQLKKCIILEKKEDKVVTEEVLSFSTIIKNEIRQQTIHRKDPDNNLHSEIISGPAKGTKIDVLFGKKESGTRVTVNLDLKLSLKAKFLQPLIKKYYKMVITSILYKMSAEIEAKTS